MERQFLGKRERQTRRNSKIMGKREGDGETETKTDRKMF